MNGFTSALLNHGILIDRGGLGCISTVMTESDIEALQDAVANALSDPSVSWPGRLR
jgi:glutamate-1-semialdehyde aminotransferase